MERRGAAAAPSALLQLQPSRPAAPLSDSCSQAGGHPHSRASDFQAPGVPQAAGSVPDTCVSVMLLQQAQGAGHRKQHAPAGPAAAGLGTGLAQPSQQQGGGGGGQGSRQAGGQAGSQLEHVCERTPVLAPVGWQLAAQKGAVQLAAAGLQRWFHDGGAEALQPCFSHSVTLRALRPPSATPHSQVLEVGHASHVGRQRAPHPGSTERPAQGGGRGGWQTARSIGLLVLQSRHGARRPRQQQVRVCCAHRLVNCWNALPSSNQAAGRVPLMLLVDRSRPSSDINAPGVAHSTGSVPAGRGEKRRAHERGTTRSEAGGTVKGSCRHSTRL